MWPGSRTACWCAMRIRRAPNLKSKPSSNPLVRINGVLQERLRGYFSYTRSVTFANRGGLN